MKIERNHDQFYLNDDRDTHLKDYFIQIADLIAKYRLTRKSKLNISDIGCAAGIFPGYLSKRTHENYKINKVSFYA